MNATTKEAQAMVEQFAKNHAGAVMSACDCSLYLRGGYEGGGNLGKVRSYYESEHDMPAIPGEEVLGRDAAVKMAIQILNEALEDVICQLEGEEQDAIDEQERLAGQDNS